MAILTLGNGITNINLDQRISVSIETTKGLGFIKGLLCYDLIIVIL